MEDMNIFLLAISIMCVFYSTALLIKRASIILLIAFSSIHYFSLYIVVSGILFLLNTFSVVLALSICLFFEIVAIIILKRKLKRRVSVDCDLRNYKLLIVFIIFAVFITGTKYEMYSMGQDEGVYQTKAIEIIYRTGKNQVDFEEYRLLTNEIDRKNYYSFLEKFNGYYMNPVYPTFSDEDKLSDISGYYHGIPTFPAVLALFGSCFGLSVMAQVQTIFTVVCIVLLYQICINLKLKKSITLLLLALYTFSPIIIWTSKSSLTEPFLGVLLAWLLYMLTDPDKRQNKILFIPILVFSLFHITCYTLMPMFVCLFVVKYFFTKDRQYLIQCALSVVCFMFGYSVSLIISPQYSYGNSAPIMVGFVQTDNLAYVVGIVCIFILMILFLLWKISCCDIIKKFFTGIVCADLFRIFLLVILGVVFVYGIHVGVTDTAPSFPNSRPYWGSGLNAVNYLTLTAFAFCTGFLLLPVAILLTFPNTKQLLKNEQVIMVTIFFSYLCLFMSAILRKEIYHYYYYCRYLAPFIIPVLVYCGLVINKIRTSYIYAIGIISCVLLFPFDHVLATQKDDSLLSWVALEEIADQFDEKDALLVTSDVKDFYIEKTALLALNAMTGVDIFPIDMTLSSSMKALLDNYDNIYYMSDRVGKLSVGEVVYSRKCELSQDYLDKRDSILPLPTGFTQTEQVVTIWKVEPDMIDSIELETKVGIRAFYTNAGVKENNTIRSIGTQGYLIYGPYVPLDVGTYKITISGRLYDGKLTEDSFFDISCNKGNTELFRASNLSQYVQDGIFEIEINFDVVESIEDCEFRIYVNSGVDLEINNTSLQKLNVK